jgi:hypothetical protein
MDGLIHSAVRDTGRYVCAVFVQDRMTDTDEVNTTPAPVQSHHSSRFAQLPFAQFPTTQHNI